MVLAAVTGGSVSSSDSPLMLTPEQTGRHWAALLDMGSAAAVSGRCSRRDKRKVCRESALCVPGGEYWHLGIRLS